ncbi:MAG: carbohydrate ABC transporter permease [Demequina sp.]|uniref:carbohydrate ABC transporter permease n=1 Tax=Demequina sp. TaxID=2050685 RepID=UPI003A8A562B
MKHAVFSGFKYTTLVVGSIVTLLPLVTIFLASFKTGRELADTGPFALPSEWTFDNYVTAWTDGKMLQGFLNTGIILIVAITGTVIIGAMTAFAIDRFDFRGRKIVLGAFLLAVLVPAVTTQVATFQVVNALGLYNTRWAAIVLFLGTDIISIYIFLQVIRAIPKELDEAARLEGAGNLRIFWQVIFPLLKPAIATVVIIKGFAAYNEFYIPFLYMPSSDLGTVSTSLFRFSSGPLGAQWQIVAAGVVIAIIPTVIIFLSMQRYIYAGMTQGATK